MELAPGRKVLRLQDTELDERFVLAQKDIPVLRDERFVLAHKDRWVFRRIASRFEACLLPY